MRTRISQADLIGKSKKELREIAATIGLQTVDGRTSEENLIKEIMRSQQPPPLPEIDLKHTSQKPKDAPKINTQAEIEAKIQRFLEKPGFTASFDEDSWHFRCKGREDSGHLSTDIRIIVMKAENVARGALKLKTIQDGPDTSGPGKANSNAILM